MSLFSCVIERVGERGSLRLQAFDRLGKVVSGSGVHSLSGLVFEAVDQWVGHASWA